MIGFSFTDTVILLIADICMNIAVSKLSTNFIAKLMGYWKVTWTIPSSKLLRNETYKSNYRECQPNHRIESKTSITQINQMLRKIIYSLQANHFSASTLLCLNWLFQKVIKYKYDHVTFAHYADFTEKTVWKENIIAMLFAQFEKDLTYPWINKISQNVFLNWIPNQTKCFKTEWTVKFNRIYDRSAIECVQRANRKLPTRVLFCREQEMDRLQAQPCPLHGVPFQ